MLNCLPVESLSRNAIRCKQCKAILFTQTDMTGFMAYDPDDFGKLTGFADRPKFEEDANFLLLSENFDMYSTLRIDHKKSLKLEYHPFFMMYMLLIECQKCTRQLGYQVETVNQNTEWMQGRLIIDTSKVALFKEGKDDLPKTIQVFRSKLVKLLERQNQSKKNPQVAYQTKILQKLEEKIINKKPSDQSKKGQYCSRNDNFTQEIKKKGFSVHSTRGQTSSFSKKWESSLSNSMGHQIVFKTGEASYGLRSYEEKEYNRGVNIAPKFLSLSMEKLQKSKDLEKKKENENKFVQYEPIELSMEIREQLNKSLRQWSQKTLEESCGLNCHQVIENILEKMWRIDAIEKMVHNKIVDQQIEMMKCNLKVKKDLLEDLMKDL